MDHAQTAMKDTVRLRGIEDGATPLHHAAGMGCYEVVKLLVDAGARLDRVDDRHGLTPLGWATVLDGFYPEVAEYLLSRGASIDIFSAVAMDQRDEVKRIVRRSFERIGRSEYLSMIGSGRFLRRMARNDPKALGARLWRGDDRYLPIHLAILKGRRGMVELLADLGADLHATTRSGKTPFHLAVEAGRRDIADLLEMRGAGAGNIGVIEESEAAGGSPATRRSTRQRFRRMNRPSRMTRAMG